MVTANSTPPHPDRATRTCRPRDHLLEAGKLYPGVWQRLDEIRSARGDGLPDWPEWCFAPIAATLAIVADDAGIDVRRMGQLYPERVPDAARLAALGAWRMTQGIYRFDPAVYDAVRDTPVDRNIPSEILYRLPEWCVYVETPELKDGDDILYGVFVHLEHDVNTGRPELRLVLDGEKELRPIALHLGAWPMAESIERMLAEANRQAGYSLAIDVPSIVASVGATVEPIVSLLLYLCSQAGEIGDGTRRPENPQPKRTKRGLRLFQAEKVSTWEVGVRMGSALRRAYAAAQTGAGGTHAGPIPHVRRSHWHTFLSGRRLREDGSTIPPEQRRADIKWMPPIAVNLPDVDDLSAVVRPVK